MTGVGILVVNGDVETAVKAGAEAFFRRTGQEANCVRIGKDIKIEGNQIDGLTVVSSDFQKSHVCVGRR